MAIFGGRQKFVNEKNMIQTTTDTYSVCFHLHKILENEYPKAVVARKGSEVRKGKDICMCMADSFCCAVEVNTTLESNHTPIKIN